MQDSSNDKPHNPHTVDPSKLAGNPELNRRRDPSVVTGDEAGIYSAHPAAGGEAGDSNSIPSNEPKDPSVGQVDGEPTNQPEVFDPRVMPPAMAEVPPEAGPLDLPPNRSRMTRHRDTGMVAREKVKDRSMKARAKRIWNWIKFILFLIIAGLIAFGYYAYETRKQGYVVEPRTCLFETEDKQVRFTGTRYYSYMQNSMFGLRWHLDADTAVKTELDIKGDALVILSWGGKGNPTSKYISTGERGTVPLAPADMWVVTMDKRSVVLESTKFCR
jgi:hypothetical protein